jgi:hypothetical protein
MGTEWVAVGILVVAGAFFIGFPFGVAVGYWWRSRISRMRRRRYLVEQERLRAGLDTKVGPLAGPDIAPAIREVAAASLSFSMPATAAEMGTAQATPGRARKKATGLSDPIAKRTGDDGKRRKKMPAKSKVVADDLLNQPGPDSTSTEQGEAKSS